MLSAIVIVGPEIQEEQEEIRVEVGDASERALPAPTPDQQGTPLVCLEILGLSVVARLMEQLRLAGVDMVSVRGNISSESRVFDFATPIVRCSTEEAWRGATHELRILRESGAEAILIIHANAYVDLDLKKFLQFHREQGQAMTRAFENGCPLDLWIVDPAGLSEEEEIDIQFAVRTAEPAQYAVRGYVNRLECPRDLRRLMVDSLTSRCGLRPRGTEIRPGVWMDEGAQVHRDARIVAPAYVGRGARIGEQCLITRSSSVESNCQVDYGTVVEDSSVLSNSYVGIGLDVSHSLVDGNSLLNFERGVMLEIADPCLIRQNGVSRPEKNFKLPLAFGLGSVHFSQAEEGSR